MKFINQIKGFIFCLIILIIYKQEHAEGRGLNLRKFSIRFGAPSAKDSLIQQLNSFADAIRQGLLGELNEELEKKRNKIFLEKLASRVSGSVLKDFHGRL